MVELDVLHSTILYFFVYFVSTLLLSLKSFVVFNKKRITNFFILIAILPPILLSAYRFNVGTDYSNYYAMYLITSNHSLFEIIDTYSLFGNTFSLFGSIPLGIAFVARIATFFDSAIVYFGLLSLLIYLPFLIIITKFWDLKTAPLLTFFFLLTIFSGGLNIIKQAISISLFLLSLQYIYKRNFLKFILVAVIAILFHPTAIIILPSYFLIDNTSMLVSKRKKMLILIASILALLVFDFVLSRLGGRWESYSNLNNATSNITFFINLFWAVIFMFFYKKYIDMDNKNDLIIMLFMVGTVFSLLGFWNVNLKRIAYYFTSVQIFIMCQVPFLFSNRFYKFLAIVALILYMLFMFLCSFSVLGHSEIIPYRFLD